MTKGILSTGLLTLALSASAQVAPDFTVTDIDGMSHNLYTWLNDGKVVIVDASATWCGPCWSLHSSHALEYLHQNFGPDGTDQLRVLFYEADASTTMADLQGLTGSSQGDWLTGTNYPVVNEAPLQLNGNIWWPQGFPTVSLIRPSDKMIVEDMWNWSYNQMVTAINQIITLNSAASVNERDAAQGMKLYPVPVTDRLVVDLTSSDLRVSNLLITDATGRQISDIPVGSNTILNVDVAEFGPGMYFVTMIANGERAAVKPFVK